MNYEELDKLKYRQLQKLAKERGLKANLSKPAMIDAILDAELEKDQADVGGKSKLDVTFEIKEDDAKVAASAASSFLSSEGGTSPAAATNEERFAQFFADQDEDDLVLTPRGSQKPRQYLPASTMKKRSLGRTSSILTIPPDSPRNDDITINLSDSGLEVKNPTPKRRVSTLMNPTASSALKSARKSSPKSSPKARKSLAPDPKNSPLRKSLVGGKGSVTKKASSKKTSLLFAAQRNSFSASAVKKVVIAEDKVTKRSNIPKRRMPNFAKLHAKMEDKMDNLNEYLSKKKDRMDALTPGKSLKSAPQSDLEGSVTKNPPVRRSPRNLPSSTFVPTVKNIKGVGFDFGKKSGVPAPNSSFKFTAVKPKTEMILTNITNNTKNFDLKASLSKPLGYKPHRGKLGSWNPKMKPEERITSIKKQESLKNISRTQIKGVRMNKRAELLLKRRGANV